MAQDRHDDPRMHVKINEERRTGSAGVMHRQPPHACGITTSGEPPVQRPWIDRRSVAAGENQIRPGRCCLPGLPRIGTTLVLLSRRIKRRIPHRCWLPLQDQARLRWAMLTVATHPDMPDLRHRVFDDRHLQLPELTTTGSMGRPKAHPLLNGVRRHREILNRLCGALALPGDGEVVVVVMRPASRQAQAAVNARWQRAKGWPSGDTPQAG
jgi:hypothetical protein